MKYYISFLFIMMAVFTSCNSFLDTEPTGTMTTGSKLSSKESAQALVNSAYINTKVFDMNVSTGWGANTTLLLEYMTGKCTSENSQSYFKDFQELTVSARTPYLEQWWTFCYAGISDCNYAIEKLAEFAGILDESQITTYLAEVKFMRALYYFYLVRIFGDVPKIKVVQTELSQLQVTRDPLKEIYDEIIIPDLLDAEKSALSFTNTTGRTSMAAVKTLLADVYLTYAGYPVQGGNQYYAESAKRTLEVIKSARYALFPTYESLWSPASNNTGEFIFQVQFTVNMRSNQMPCVVLPPRSGMSAFELEFGSLVPTKEFVDSYADGDKRTEEKQFFFTTYKGNPNKFPAGSPELTFLDFHGYYIHKFFDQQAIDVAGQSGLNWTIYRYADVLLLYAEAQVKAEGVANTEALAAFNQIRNRARLPGFTDTNQDAFLKAVWDERYFELCYENKIWFDMLRTRKVRDDKTGNYVDFIGFINNWGKTYTSTQLLFPIPLREMQANSNLVQNPGY